jgi:predicted component of type VI protein secretion system
MTSQNRRLPGATRVVLTASASVWLAACATSAPMDKPGHVTLDVAADAGLVPEPRELVQDFEEELTSLAEAVRASGHSPLH